jgi:hypothetical protein
MVVNQCVSDGSIIDVTSSEIIPLGIILSNAQCSHPTHQRALEDAQTFLHLDWLDEVKPDDLERAGKVLQTSKSPAEALPRKMIPKKCP